MPFKWLERLLSGIEHWLFFRRTQFYIHVKLILIISFSFEINNYIISPFHILSQNPSIYFSEFFFKFMTYFFINCCYVYICMYMYMCKYIYMYMYIIYNIFIINIACSVQMYVFRDDHIIVNSHVLFPRDYFFYSQHFLIACSSLDRIEDSLTLACLLLLSLVSPCLGNHIPNAFPLTSVGDSKLWFSSS